MANEKAYINTGLVILAAGESSRLGSPKQLLVYSGTILLKHSIEMAKASAAGSVIVVLGAKADLISDELKNIKVKIVVNLAWREGMASSICCGLKRLVELNPQVEAVVLMVADQPFVTPSLLNNLMDLHIKEQSSIVASKYGDTFGTPVLFAKRFFPELLDLTGDVGAKSLIRKYMNETAFVHFPKGNIDIDTLDDYTHLSEK